MSNKHFNSDQISFGRLKDFSGINIKGDKGHFLAIDRQADCWRFKLFDLKKESELTSWITAERPQELKTSKNAAFLRNQFEDFFANSDEVLEQILILIQNNEDKFRPPEKEGKKAEGETEEFDEETKRKARELLRDLAFFYKLGRVLECGFIVSRLNKPRFILGEERNRILVSLLLIGASKLDMTSIVKVLGDPGTAKDTLVRMGLTLLPIKSIERSNITPASLRYSRELRDTDLIYIPDSPELSGEMGRHLRFMRADDGGLTSEYTMKDPKTNELVTKIVEIPIKGLVTTSNAITGDTALESGMWTLRTDASEELTKRVKMEKLKLRAGNRQFFPESELEVWKCAFKILVTEELPEVLPKIPFAESLMALVESGRSESRRDPDKLCDLISLIAWTRRFQKDRDKRGEADFVDLYYALQIGLDAISQTIGELNEKEQKIFQTLEGKNYTCRAVAEATKIPYKTCYSYLDKLVTKGYVNVAPQGRENIYTILSDKKPKSFLISANSILSRPDLLMELVLNSFGGFSRSQEDISTVLVDPLSGTRIVVEKEGERPKVSTEPISEELKSYPYPSENMRSSERSRNKAPDLKNKPETLLSSGMRVETDSIHAVKKEPSAPSAQDSGQNILSLDAVDLSCSCVVNHG